MKQVELYYEVKDILHFFNGFLLWNSNVVVFGSEQARFLVDKCLVNVCCIVNEFVSEYPNGVKAATNYVLKTF